ncbi:uncharacterized protein L201_004500 [Kwoniella dendrophila CBS 6074]|uniref:NAD(P)-binding domain-containing protein n=1 Tax=Kwoniella dendrophila CBS 6074 TaxID=1295534 RepID=A0AAX4JVX3_9TREE
MKVFATGATGWVGRHLVPELLSHGHTITAIARSESSIASLEEQGVTVVRGSLADTDLLHSSAKASDAVVHLAYIHDFSEYADLTAVNAMCSALEGTDKPFVGTSVLGLPLPQDETASAIGGPRKESEELCLRYSTKGVKSMIVRLPSSVHGKGGDHAFIPYLIKLAKEKGYSAYPKETKTRWTGVHVKDAAVLFRLAIEDKNQSIRPGSILHGVAEPSISFIEIAKLIGNSLNLETKELETEQEINGYFGWMAMILAFDGNAISEITRRKTGWIPSEIGLMEDIRTNYF